MGELVSVIIPIYNVEIYLERCIKSLIHQTYTNVEILLIDDGSEDSSLAICKEFEEIDSRIKVVHKANEGLGITRNYGLKEARGRYVVFVDSDDYITLDAIEILYRDITKNKCDLVIADHFYKGEPNGIPIVSGVYSEHDVVDNVYMHMLGGHAKKKDDLCVSVCGNIYDINLIRDHHICFPSERKLIWEDLVFNSSYLLFCNRVYMEGKPLYHYCYNVESLTHRYDPDKLVKVMKMYSYMQQQIAKFCFKNCQEATERLQNNFMGNIRTCLKLEVYYSHKNGKEMALKNIKAICNDKEVVELLENYPTSYYTKTQYIYNFAILHKLYRTVYLLTWLQNRKKKRIE